MPRQARKKSKTGIYHVMLRGINHQQIFEDNEDKQRFIETLARYKDECGYYLYAYCLMGNHIHILLKEGMEEISSVLKRIAASYVYWYNWKYNRCGHLFQDRFKSEPVEDDGYFLAVLRYIHQNPIKARICSTAEEFPFSSFNEYTNIPKIIDTNFAFSIISKEDFIVYHSELNDDYCLENDERTRISDLEAKEIIYNLTDCKSVADFQVLDKHIRNNYIKVLHDYGLSVRQINRLTGISKKIVENNLI